MLKKPLILLSALLMVSLTSCSAWYQYHQEVRDANLVKESYKSVDVMLHKIGHPLPRNSLIIVSTLVNIDNKNQTSSFGRIISNQVASALHDQGFQIIAMELPTDLFVVEEGGQLHLPPETRQMLKRYNATNIVGGVYAPGKKNAYISLRMIDLASRSYISSADYSVPMGPDAKALLKPTSVGSDPVPVAANTSTSPNPVLVSPEQPLLEPTTTEAPAGKSTEIPQ